MGEEMRDVDWDIDGREKAMRCLMGHRRKGGLVSILVVIVHIYAGQTRRR
jgi:hypothetical protein